MVPSLVLELGRRALCQMDNSWHGGGMNRVNLTETPVRDAIIVYDLKTNTWTPKYVAPSLPTTPASTAPETTSTAPVILAPSLGACILIIVVGAVMMCRARSKKTRINVDPMEATGHLR